MLDGQFLQWITSMRNVSILTAGSALITIAVLVTIWSWISTGSVGELRPGDDAVVAQGSRIYAQYCASCHGADLQGEANWKQPGPDGRMPAPPHDETGHTWHHDGRTLFRLVKFGTAALLDPGSSYETNMPTYDGVLEDEEILAVLSYIKSTRPDDVRQRHDEMEVVQ